MTQEKKQAQRRVMTSKFVPSGARTAFLRQRASAFHRGVGWALTFEEWVGIWLDSGKWWERGRGRGKYVMARTGDRGPYKVGNVRIDLHENNAREGNQTRIRSIDLTSMPICGTIAHSSAGIA